MKIRRGGGWGSFVNDLFKRECINETKRSTRTTEERPNQSTNSEYMANKATRPVSEKVSLLHLFNYRDAQL